MSQMLRIAITPPEIRQDECEYISAILDAGWERVHLRHPDADRETLCRILNGLSPSHRRRVKLHSHFELASEYELCGIHLNKRCGEIPRGFQGEISSSLHSLKELESLKSLQPSESPRRYAYVTLSPIFDSISKHGYSAQWDAEELRRSLAMADTPVIALGGITPDKTAWLKDTGFDGYAVLGYLDNAESIEDLKVRLQQFDDKQ